MNHWKRFVVLILLFGLNTCQSSQKVLTCSDDSELESECVITGIKELKPFQYGGFHKTDVYGNRRSICPTQITFSECEIHFVPARVFTSCPQITHFDMSLSNVKFVSDYVFEGIQNLLELKLSYNEIKELHDFTFMYGANLLRLDLSDNELRKITNDTFNGLEVLETLDLSNNLILMIETNSFKSLTALQEIHLYDNFLSEIDKTIFSENPLKLLDLADNQLTEFVFFSRHRLKLKKIDLSNNLLIEFNEVLYADRILLNNNNLTRLILNGTTTELQASNNLISSIYVDNKIEILTLSRNNISDIRNLTSLSNLQILDLSFNNISAINDSSFSLLQNLQQLILGNANLVPFHFSTFSHQKMIKKFDISYNNLENIDFDDFVSMQDLEELFIDGNDLKEVKYDEINNNFPKLRIIGLSNNNWNCSYLTKMRKNIFLNKIQIHIDPNMYAQNITNIGGVGCSDDKNIQNIIDNMVWKNVSTPISKHSGVDERSEQLNQKINSLLAELKKLQDKDKVLVEKLLDMEKKLTDKDLNETIPEPQNTTTTQLDALIDEVKQLSSKNKEHQSNDQLTALIDEFKKLSSSLKDNRGNSSSGVLLVFLIISISSVLVVYTVHLYMKKRERNLLSLSRTPMLDTNL